MHQCLKEREGYNMASTYSQWSVDKLKKELAKIEKAIKAKETSQKKQVVAELKAVARKHGYALSDLLDSNTPKNKPKTAPTTVGKRVNGTTKANGSLARSLPVSYTHLTLPTKA